MAAICRHPGLGTSRNQGQPLVRGLGTNLDDVELDASVLR